MMLRKHSGVISTLVFSIITTLGVLFMTPLVLQNYGSKLYILWSISNSVCALLFILDFGITSVASQKFLTLFERTGVFSRDTWREFIRFHSKTLALASIFLLAIFILQIYLQKNLQFSLYYLTIFILTVVSTLITILCHEQIIKYQIRNRYQTALNLITFFKLFELLLTLLMLFLAVNFIVICLSVVLIRCFQLVLLQSSTKMLFQKDNLIRVIHPGNTFPLRIFVGSMLYSSSSVLGIHATFLLQSIFMNPNETVTLLITRMIASPIRIFADSLAIGHFDGLLRKTLHSTNTEPTHKPKSVILDHLVLFSFTTAYFVFANLFGHALINFLSSGQLELNSLLLNLFCLATMLDGMIVIFMQFRISSGMQHRIGFSYLLTTILGLIMLLILVQHLDLYAGVISIIFCDLLFVLIRIFTQESKSEN
jgi:hypothetical protein